MILFMRRREKLALYFCDSQTRGQSDYYSLVGIMSQDVLRVRTQEQNNQKDETVSEIFLAMNLDFSAQNSKIVKLPSRLAKSCISTWTYDV